MGNNIINTNDITLQAPKRRPEAPAREKLLHALESGEFGAIRNDTRFEAIVSSLRNG